MGLFDNQNPGMGAQGVPIVGAGQVPKAAPYRPDLDKIGFKALGDIVVAVLDLTETVSPGGIVIPERAQKTPFHIALSVGPDVQNVAVGDRIMATGGANMEAASGNRVFFFHAKDILAIVHKLDEEGPSEDELIAMANRVAAEGQDPTVQ